jgi:hypothetical protein
MDRLPTHQSPRPPTTRALSSPALPVSIQSRLLRPSAKADLPLLRLPEPGKPTRPLGRLPPTTSLRSSHHTLPPSPHHRPTTQHHTPNRSSLQHPKHLTPQPPPWHPLSRQTGPRPGRDRHRCDNGPESTAMAIVRHLERTGTATVQISPGAIWDNGNVESFDCRPGHQLLNCGDFQGLWEAR